MAIALLPWAGLPNRLPDFPGDYRPVRIEGRLESCTLACGLPMFSFRSGQYRGDQLIAHDPASIVPQAAVLATLLLGAGMMALAQRE